VQSAQAAALRSASSLAEYTVGECNAHASYKACRLHQKGDIMKEIKESTFNTIGAAITFIIIVFGGTFAYFALVADALR